MTENDVLRQLRTFVREHPTQDAAARALGISPQHLSDTLKRKRAIGPAVLRALGLRKVELFEKVA